MKIFSKITSNEYNDELENILENKTFSENVKNLLLSMLYKIENGYKDYAKVKYNAMPRKVFMENILKIIDEQCFEITVVTPKTEMSKPLEEANVICKIDADRGSILVYANEEDLLYSIIQMNLLQEKKKEKATYYEKAIREFYIRGQCINDSEIIRDFDGWSWNNNIKTTENIEYNLVFQNINILNIEAKSYNENFEKNLIKSDRFYESLYIIILTLESEKNEKIKKEVIDRYKELTKILDLMNNRVKFLNKITEDKKKIVNNIKEIDETINDKAKLRIEYEKRNSKLPNKEKIFSVSILTDILENERKEKLEELKNMNKFLDPREYLIQKDILDNEKKILENVVENINNATSREQAMINLQIEFLKKFEQQIEKNTDNKEYLEKIIYTLRYYCLLPVSKNKCINDIEELRDPIGKVMNNVIDNCIDKEIITNFSNSASLCYNILKYAFITKIIDLKEVQIKITKLREEKYVAETQYYVSISICDTKEIENVYKESLNNLDLLNVKMKKTIPLFLK